MPASFEKTLLSPTKLVGAALAGYWLAMGIATHIPVSWLLAPGSSADEMLARGGDKPVHLLAYAGLAFLLRMFLSLKMSDSRAATRLTLAICFSYAIADELLQIPVNRTADVQDVLADWTGTGVGLLVFFVCARYVPLQKLIPATLLRKSA